MQVERLWGWEIVVARHADRGGYLRGWDPNFWMATLAVGLTILLRCEDTAAD